MDKQKKLWLIVAIAIIVIILIIIFISPKKEKFDENVFEGFSEQDLKNAPEAPELNINKIQKPIEVVPGASKVDSVGQVLTEQGEAVQTKGISPNAQEAPKQSAPLTEQEIQNIPDSVFKMEISSEKGFVPNQFKAKPGQVVTIALTSVDGANHILRFEDRELRGLAISVEGNETKALTFNAPLNQGVYEFMCGQPDHRDKEIGQMLIAE